MLSPINQGLSFLISSVFDLYIFILMLRLLLVYIRADFYNPLSQFVIKFTQMPITAFKRFLPNIKQIEIATLVFILVLEAVKFLLLGLVIGGVIANILGLLVLSCADFLKSFINIFIYAILIGAVLSWVQPYHPVCALLRQMTYPIMRPFYKIIPPINGVDITPIPVMIGLYLILIVLITPMLQAGQAMAFRL